MALSASTDFPVTRDDLIKAALQHIGAIGDGDTPTATQLSEAGLLLNMLIKNWTTDGMQLWMRYYGYIFPVSGVQKTSLGAEGGNAATAYRWTTTSAASAAAATTITVTTVTGISNTNIIGVEQSDGTMQWTTVNGAPVGNVVTLTAALTGDVASGANVYAYATTAKLTRPVDIVEAFRRHSADDSDTPLREVSNQEYNNLSSKTEEGAVLQWSYDKVLGFSTTGYPGNGDFYFWPRFENGDDVIVIKYIKEFDDLDSATQNPEFPQEWFLPIMLGLAWLLSPKNGIPLKERQLLFQEAQFYKDLTLDDSVERTSMYITPAQN
jgi:hypothetical protein